MHPHTRSLLCLNHLWLNENVEPIITIAEGLAARLIGVPNIVIAEEPGVRVWLSSRYLPTGKCGQRLGVEFED